MGFKDYMDRQVIKDAERKADVSRAKAGKTFRSSKGNLRDAERQDRHAEAARERLAGRAAEVESRGGNVEVVLLGIGSSKDRLRVVKALRKGAGLDMNAAMDAVKGAEKGREVPLGRFSAETSASLEAVVVAAGGNVRVTVAEPPPDSAAESTPSASGDVVAGLERLAALREAGAITDAEFATAKERILSGLG